MSKTSHLYEKYIKMHQIVLFIEPSYREFETPFKIASLFTNRFTINEDASFEIVKIFELDRKSNLTKNSWKECQEELYQKGMNPITKFECSYR